MRAGLRRMLGYSLEQTLKLRRAPFSTPALLDGKAPAPVTFLVRIDDGRDRLAVMDFTHDPITSRLTYKTTFVPGAARRVKAIWIHRTADEKPGAAVYQLLGGAASNPAGVLTLSYEDREALDAGRLRVRVYTDDKSSPLEVHLRAVRLRDSVQ